MKLKKTLVEIYKKTFITIALTTLLAAGSWQGSLQVFAVGQSPVITYPTENQFVNEGNVQITWEAIPGVTAYNCQIWDLTSGSTMKTLNFSTTTTHRVYSGHSYRFVISPNYNGEDDFAMSSEVHFSVESLASSITLDTKTLSLKANQSSLLTATVSPSNATNKDIIWTSSDESVASVDSSGLVTGIASGSATIYVTTTDGSRSSSCNVTVMSDTVSVTSVSVNPSNLSLQAGQTGALATIITPSNATNQSVLWTSSNPSVATVNEYGEVSAISAGNATITAKTDDGNRTANCFVTVTSSSTVGTAVTSVSVSPKNLSLYSGKTGSLTATFTPSNATNKSVTWTTSDPTVATVDANGVVSAVSAGKATVTVTTDDGNKTSKCSVMVISSGSSSTSVTSVSVNPKSLSLQSGKTRTLAVTVSPSNASNKSVTWSTSNSSVATVSTNGTVTTVSEGISVVTATTDDGNKADSCVVTVMNSATENKPVTSVSISPKSLSLQTGKTGSITATVSPSNATNKSVTWTTSNPSVATVSEKGVVTAVSDGTATITSTTDDGNKTADCVVTVTTKIDTYAVNFSAGNGGTLSATVDGKTISSGTMIPADKMVTFTATPNSGFNINAWKLNGSVVESHSGAQTYNLSNLSSSAKVTVEFSVVVLTGTTATSPRSTTLEATEFSSSFPRWAWITTSFLVQNNDGTVSHVSASDVDSVVRVETTGASGNNVSDKSITYELPIFGGFLSGESYNYIAFGQENTEKSNGKEVIRIVKYDKNFNKLGSASINGGTISTKEPFHATGARLVERDGKLVLHTGRTRYDAHQSNLTIAIDTNTMNVTYQSAVFPPNHVSHSFDQYVLYDGAQPVFLDHGDAYPRGVILQRGTAADSLTDFHEATMFKIPGKTGANCTGVTVGGFGMSGQNYLAAITTIDHNKAKGYTSFEILGLELDQRDILVCVLPKSFKNGATAKQITIGKYVGTDKIASTPKMLSNGDGSFTLLWQEFSLSKTPGDFVAQTIDSSGSASGSERRYNNLGEFYQEFLKVSALPASFKSLSEPTGAKASDTRSITSLETPAANVSDASSWATDSISQALQKGFVPSYLQGRYKQVINREEFCRMAVSWVEYTTGKDIDTIMAEKGVKRNAGTFSDTNDNDILAAYALGITSGTGDGKFSPDSNFTREQAATMIQNTCRAIGANVSNPPASNFADMGNASSWAVNGINYCRAKGIMQGTGNNNFSPKDTYTIEQSIITFNNIDKDKL